MKFCNSADLRGVTREVLFDPPLDITARPFVHFHRERCVACPAATNRGFRQVLVKDEPAQVFDAGGGVAIDDATIVLDNLPRDPVGVFEISPFTQT